MSLKFTRLLQFGMQGADITRLQLEMKARGYALTGTGYFGNSTDSAVRAFQRSAGLNPDGKVGNETIDRWNASLAGGEVGPTVAEIARPLWLVEAIALIGTKETAGSGDNPVIIEWAQEIGGEIAAEYKHDSIPWCALFIGHCLTKCGQKSDDSLYALDYGRYGQKLAGPAVGAIASMSRSGGGHVVFVIGRDGAGNLVCVGGNQSDAVNIRAFPPARIAAYNWPATSPLPSSVGFDKLPKVNSAGVEVSTKEN